MSTDCQPHVSIVTPMHNNAEHVAECIESVLAQTYSNWDYVIVNNCCTDGSDEIARKFAKTDSRIRIIDNEKLLPAVVNHNHALRQISPKSKYTKMVFSDDWLFPHCIEQMVNLAEANASVGIVSAYGLQGVNVVWTGLSYPSNRVPGHELCHDYFLKGLYVFGTSQSVLYRSDDVRRRDPFFNEASMHPDREVCLDILRDSDLGFVHQVLTYSRVRPGSLTDKAAQLNTSIAGRLFEATKYGPEFLCPAELSEYVKRLLDEYYNYLAISLMQRKESAFWNYHKQKFAEAGFTFSYPRLVAAFVKRCLIALVNPAETLAKLKLMRPAS